MQRQVILDTETTGLEPADGHRVIEIGCVEIANRRLTGRHWHVYLNPDRDSDEGALRVHGLTREFLSDKPRFEAVVEQLLQFVDGAEVIIHNAEFDLKFLDAEFVRLGRPSFRSHLAQITDSLLHARELHPGKRNSLDALCDRYGISNAHRSLHGALLDSELLAEVWLAMTRGQDGLLLDSAQEPTAMAQTPVVSLSDVSSQLLVLQPTPEELAEHAAYLDGLDQACKQGSVWRRVAA